MNGGVRSGATRILWHNAEQASAERFTGGPTAGGWQLDGLLVLPVEGVPALVTYRVDADSEWRTRRADVTVESGEAGDRAATRHFTFEADGRGGWAVDGQPAGSLDGCLDVDLGFTPATNTLSIRRLQLGVGETRTLPVAWLPFPELVVQRNEQSYTRLEPDRWLYRSGDFSAELDVDADGYVLRYDDLWTAVAHQAA
jgi:hypothetical protein